MKNKIGSLGQRGRIRLDKWRGRQQLIRQAASVSRMAAPGSATSPVIFFSATTRIHGLSLNGAFSLLAAWAVRLNGMPVVHFACRGGMSKCVLGTSREDPSRPMPCEGCIHLSEIAFRGAEVHFFTYRREPRLAAAINDLDLPRLMTFTYPFPTDLPHARDENRRVPLGSLVLPSLRWALRCHHLVDDETTRFLYREYILSAWNVTLEFSALVEKMRPRAAVIFNGQFFPEAAARWVCRARGILSVTHEVAMQPLSAFFTTGEATAYPIDIPDDFSLNEARNARLDSYLEKRFQGRFTMAGVRFWPEMSGLDEGFLDRARNFRQIVPIFTNVIFDTSQPHSNVVFENMFDWLDLILEIIRKHPETLFVIRAHPDESRAGKASQESVAMWVEKNQVEQLVNVMFVKAHEFISSYELIQRSKFIMVYNSTIGMEAAIMGAPVLCGGKARFTQVPMVFFPGTVEAYHQQAEDFLSRTEIEVPAAYQENARRFLYFQLFRTSLPFGEFLRPDAFHPGFVYLKGFNVRRLRESASARAIMGGLCNGLPFTLEEPD